MVTLNIGDHEYSYERVAKNRSENVFEAVLIVESRTGELSVRRFELDVSARDDLSSDHVEEALEEWLEDHENLTIHRVVIEETNRCAFGTRLPEGAVAESESDESEGAEAPAQRAAADGELYRGGSTARAQVGFGDVDVDHGDEIEYYVAGPSTSVYGTDSGTVTGIKSGTEDYHILVVDTDDGTKRVREDWVVDEDDE